MRNHTQTFKVFAERRIEEYLSALLSELKKEVEEQTEDDMLNVSQEAFTSYLASKYSIEPSCLDSDQMTVERVERQIRAEDFPDRITFFVEEGKSYPKPVFVYHIPYEGDVELLRCQPTTFVRMTYPMFFKENGLCFEIVGFSSGVEDVKRDAEERRHFVQQQFERVLADVAKHNDQLGVHAGQVFQQRKQRILTQRELTEALGVPIRLKTDVRATYTVPALRDRHQIAVKPSASEKGFQPEPTLPSDTYRHILTIVHDVLKVIERLPSLYANKSEEDLRDQLLMYLTPRFDWSATGETFNGSGKTDILLRWQNHNLFVAECKFWKGQKAYLATIDQLLSYLTWRDSKAAIVLFVPNAEFSSVVSTVEQATPEHANYLGGVNKHDDTWFNYRFHISGDRNREVKLAVLLCHTPKT